MYVAGAISSLLSGEENRQSQGGGRYHGGYTALGSNRGRVGLAVTP